MWRAHCSLRCRFGQRRQHGSARCHQRRPGQRCWLIGSCARASRRSRTTARRRLLSAPASRLRWTQRLEVQAARGLWPCRRCRSACPRHRPRRQMRRGCPRLGAVRDAAALLASRPHRRRQRSAGRPRGAAWRVRGWQGRRPLNRLRRQCCAHRGEQVTPPCARVHSKVKQCRQQSDWRPVIQLSPQDAVRKPGKHKQWHQLLQRSCS